MSENEPVAGAELTPDQINSEVAKRLARYEAHSFLERFAMYMGLAQALEITLKQLLNRKYSIDFDALEKATLGRVARLLSDNGLRPDFIAYLNAVVEQRNHIAHELMANQIMLAALGAGEARFEYRELEKAIFDLERLWYLYEWTEEHDAWG